MRTINSGSLTNFCLARLTGGASGIGKAICKELAANDVYVIISDINERSGQTLEAELNKEAITSRFVYLDVTEYNSLEGVFKGIYKEFGRLDYLFNNAGIAMYGEMYDTKIDD